MPQTPLKAKKHKKCAFEFCYSAAVAAHVIPPSLPSLGEVCKFKRQAALGCPRAPEPGDLQPSASASHLKLEVPGVPSYRVSLEMPFFLSLKIIYLMVS